MQEKESSVLENDFFEGGFQKIEKERENVSGLDFATFFTGIIMAALSAVVCMQIIGKMGTTPNTSLIGALIAMVMARIPLTAFKKLKNLERQNYIQTMVSGAGFTAANIGLLALSMFWVLGEVSYLYPMALGGLMGAVVSIIMVGKIFDSSIYPAEAAWPPGVATANAIQAGDEGGNKGTKLLQGIALGIIGTAFKIPVAGFGVAFLANILAITGLAVGLMIRGYSGQIFGFNLGATYIPHGIMLGAGGMALIQCLMIICKKKEPKEKYNVTVSDEKAKKTIVSSIAIYIVGALALALFTGIYSQLSIPKLILWVLFSGISASVTMLLVGMAAMHSGWFPAFAITTIFVMVGIFLGFPPITVAVLTGYICSVGPCFADMGFDLKSGWIIRGKGKNPEYEIFGRKQQVYFELAGCVIGMIVVLLSMNLFFKADLLPPISKVFATTINAAVDPSLIKTLVLWAIPGALIQLFGKAENMVGVLFATGLLINNPIYGVGIFVAVLFRLKFGKEMMEYRDAGLIVGDGLYGFIKSIIGAFY